MRKEALRRRIIAFPHVYFIRGNMLIKKIKTYKWQALASLMMTGLMVTSSLLQPRYLEVLEAVLAVNMTIYSIVVDRVALVGLVAGGVNVTLAAYIAQGVSSGLPARDAFTKDPDFLMQCQAIQCRKHYSSSCDVISTRFRTW